MIYYKEGIRTTRPVITGVINPSQDTILAAGWKEYVDNRPPYNSNTQRLIRGNVIEGVQQYQVVDLSEEEIKASVVTQTESQAEEIIQSRIKKQVETQLQEIDDDEEILANQAAYPVWDRFPDQYPFGPNAKVQSFEGTELKIFKIIQPHNKQDDRVPITVPALWGKIEFGAGKIEVWSQPTGGDGKYPSIDLNTGLPYRVLHNSQTWETRRATLNTSEPGTNDSGWMRVSNLPAPWHHIGNEGYPLNWEMIHNGFLWRNDSADNFWEPGVFGWTQL